MPLFSNAMVDLQYLADQFYSLWDDLVRFTVCGQSKPCRATGRHRLTGDRLRSFVLPGGADTHALGLRLIVSPFHDYEGGDHVDQVGGLRAVDALIGERDQVDSGLDDAEKQRVGRQDFLSAQAIQ